jgi:hypothetical protein
VERTLLSAAFEVGFSQVSCREPVLGRAKGNTKTQGQQQDNNKSGGQECPPHTLKISITRIEILNFTFTALQYYQ